MTETVTIKRTTYTIEHDVEIMTAMTRLGWLHGSRGSLAAVVKDNATGPHPRPRLVHLEQAPRRRRPRRSSPDLQQGGLMPTQLDRAAVAARYGILPASVTKEVKRGSLPNPDGYIGRSPWWWSTTLDAWERPGRTGRPRKVG